MDDYAVGRFKAFYNLIIYGYDTMNSPQVVNSSCRNNQEQEEGYNAGIAEIALNRECIKAYIERRTTERYLDATLGTRNRRICTCNIQKNPYPTLPSRSVGYQAGPHGVNPLPPITKRKEVNTPSTIQYVETVHS